MTREIVGLAMLASGAAVFFVGYVMALEFRSEKSLWVGVSIGGALMALGLIVTATRP